MATDIDLTTIEGTRLSISAGRAVVASAEPFTTSIPSEYSRSPETCGEIIGAVAEVIASQPPYLSHASGRRHLCLLDHLLRSRYEVLGIGANLSGPVRTEPLDRFGAVLRLWIDSFLYQNQETRSRFIGMCALDTALTLIAIAFGSEQRSMSGAAWKLAGLWPAPSDDRYRLDRLRQPAYRLALIGALADRWLLARVPDGASISIVGHAKLIAGDQLFLLATPSQALNQEAAPRYRIDLSPGNHLLSPISIPGLINTARAGVSAASTWPIHHEALKSPFAVPSQFDSASSFVPLDWIIATVHVIDPERFELIATSVPWHT